MGDFEPMPGPTFLGFDHHRPYGSIGGVPRLVVDFRSFDPAARNVLLGHASVLVTVDSGSDVTMLPRRFAAPLRISLDDSTKTAIPGAGGARVPCYRREWLEAQLCGQWVRLPVRFFAEEQRTGALLGRAGAFDALRLAFVHGQMLMYVCSAHRLRKLTAHATRLALSARSPASRASALLVPGQFARRPNAVSLQHRTTRQLEGR
jgi:hypothetical protein